MTNFLQLATDKYEEITKKLTSLSAEKEKLLELMRKSHTVQGQEAT
jgi:chemotaxis protein histidine kinase CheA